jgi:hypothetical protein
VSDRGAEGLPDETRLWRRVPPSEWIPPEGEQTEIVPKGSAFRTKGSEDGVSVGIASCFEGRGEGPEALLALADGSDRTWGVLEVTVGQIREMEGLDVIPDDSDAFHALIVPPPSGGRARAISKRLATWVLTPQWP